MEGSLKYHNHPIKNPAGGGREDVVSELLTLGSNQVGQLVFVVSAG